MVEGPSRLRHSDSNNLQHRIIFHLPKDTSWVSYAPSDLGNRYTEGLITVMAGHGLESPLRPTDGQVIRRRDFCRSTQPSSFGIFASCID